MTKVGENRLPPNVETKAHIQKTLEGHIRKFEETLERYRLANTDEEQRRLKAAMYEQVGLIAQLAAEVKRQGTHKQEFKVEKDYKAFLESGSDESYAALKHDISTLHSFCVNPIHGGESKKQTPLT